MGHRNNHRTHLVKKANFEIRATEQRKSPRSSLCLRWQFLGKKLDCWENLTFDCIGFPEFPEYLHNIQEISYIDKNEYIKLIN